MSRPTGPNGCALPSPQGDPRIFGCLFQSWHPGFQRNHTASPCAILGSNLKEPTQNSNGRQSRHRRRIKRRPPFGTTGVAGGGALGSGRAPDRCSSMDGSWIFVSRWNPRNGLVVLKPTQTGYRGKKSTHRRLLGLGESFSRPLRVRSGPRMATLRFCAINSEHAGHDCGFP